MDSNESLSKLKEGNSRFVSGKSAPKDLQGQRKETLSGQNPFAIILACSDSRVPPEHIFDAGIGELFVVRTAGNVVDAIALGSIEYAAEHLRAPLLVVLGHEKCGAVAAACASGHAEGNVDAVVGEMQEAVRLGGHAPERVVAENINCVLAKIRKKSAICSHLEKDGKLKIAGAIYSLSSGEVRYL